MVLQFVTDTSTSSEPGAAAFVGRFGMFTRCVLCQKSKAGRCVLFSFCADRLEATRISKHARGDLLPSNRSGGRFESCCVERRRLRRSLNSACGIGQNADIS